MVWRGSGSIKRKTWWLLFYKIHTKKLEIPSFGARMVQTSNKTMWEPLLYPKYGFGWLTDGFKGQQSCQRGSTVAVMLQKP